MKSTLFQCSRREPPVRSTSEQGAAPTVAAVPVARRDVTIGRRPWRVVVGAVGVALSCLIGTGTASATRPPPVDESRLVPALAPGWDEWTCKLKTTGPVCKAERHLSFREEADLPCDVPLYSRSTIDTYQTRYYDHDYLNYYREFRQTSLDEMSTSPEGPVTATIRARSRWVATFDLPGDGGTTTITATGKLWEVRRADGARLLSVVGTSVEPYNGPATFSGRITTEEGTEYYENVPLDVPIELFFVAVCDATAH